MISVVFLGINIFSDASPLARSEIRIQKSKQLQSGSFILYIFMLKECIFAVYTSSTYCFYPENILIYFLQTLLTNLLNKS